MLQIPLSSKNNHILGRIQCNKHRSGVIFHLELSTPNTVSGMKHIYWMDWLINSIWMNILKIKLPSKANVNNEKLLWKSTSVINVKQYNCIQF